MAVAVVVEEEEVEWGKGEEGKVEGKEEEGKVECHMELRWE